MTIRPIDAMRVAREVGFQEFDLVGSALDAAARLFHGADAIVAEGVAGGEPPDLMKAGKGYYVGMSVAASLSEHEIDLADALLTVFRKTAEGMTLDKMLDEMRVRLERCVDPEMVVVRVDDHDLAIECVAIAVCLVERSGYFDRITAEIGKHVAKEALATMLKAANLGAASEACPECSNVTPIRRPN
ncbi:MAG TPA: hypothetical protein VFS43_40760 [Polyangiaceae bacterium]|nr:hypothetical protein [Polyangiaceae bacterium]